jgi:hypothetical protein
MMLGMGGKGVGGEAGEGEQATRNVKRRKKDGRSLRIPSL